MADALLKDIDGSLKRVKWFKNNNGTIDQVIDDVYFNLNGEVVKFPQLAHCTVNLDGLTWAGGKNKVFSSSFLPGSKWYDLRWEDRNKQDFGETNDRNHNGDGVIRVRPGARELILGKNRLRVTIIPTGGSIGGSSKTFTYYIAFRCHTVTHNSDVTLFQSDGNPCLKVINDTQIRFTGSGLNSSLTGTMAGTGFMDPSYQSIALTRNGNRWELFVNNTSVGVIANANVDFSSPYSIIINDPRGNSLAHALKIKHIALWDSDLTLEEIKVLNKLNNITHGL